MSAGASTVGAVPLAREERVAAWRMAGASPDEAEELVRYAASPLHAGAVPRARYPLAESPSVAAWERYAREAGEQGAEAILRRAFVQLAFPVAPGMSAHRGYLEATRRGARPATSVERLEFADPAGLRIFLHATPAGRVPVVAAAARVDFEALVRALTRRNEPEPVPASMGACLVAGYNNWDRVDAHRRAHEAAHPEDWNGEGWAEVFRALAPRKELYQDRFMLVSTGAYSALPAAEAGLGAAEWAEQSMRIRVAHETTHFFMRAAFGVMRKSLLDELVADVVGLLEARGRFEAALFLRFMGVVSDPAPTARLANYRGDPPLTDGAFAVLPRLVRAAADATERLGLRPPRTPVATACLVTALTRVGLEGLASSALALFAEAHEDAIRAAESE